MYESAEDVRRLQELLDRTLAHANPHMLRIVKPERRLTARQVVTYLQGTKHVAFATVNERGQPRVAPLDGVFVRGRFTVSTGGEATRLRHLRANPACSAVHMDGDRVGIAAHGHATVLEAGDAGVDELDRIWTEIYGSSPFSWGQGVVFMVIEPTSMWAYAFHPEEFPES
jgi:Pyridoxamine 5'-phosphate oxidase